MIKWIRQFRISLLHAKFHKSLRKSEAARSSGDILQFKKHVYACEDAWRKLVILTEKSK